MNSPFVLANSHMRSNKSKSPLSRKDLHPQPKNSYLDNLNKYPVFDHMKLGHYGSRPKPMKLEQLTSVLEELYTDRYEVEMQNIRASVNKILEAEDIRREIRDFNEFLYDYFLRRYQNNRRKAEETLLSVLATLELNRKEYLHLQLFNEFMLYTYTPDDISCFLLIRSLIERELGVRIVSLDKKNIIDLTKIGLTKKQAKKVFEQFMVDEPTLLVQKSFQRFMANNFRIYNSEMIRPYEMMVYGVKEYKNIADKKVNQSVKQSVASTGSYIDSCLFNTLNQNKKIRQNSTKLTFGMNNFSDKGFVSPNEDSSTRINSQPVEKENQWPSNLNSKKTGEFHFGNNSKHASESNNRDQYSISTMNLQSNVEPVKSLNLNTKPLKPYPEANMTQKLGPSAPSHKNYSHSNNNSNMFDHDTFRKRSEDQIFIESDPHRESFQDQSNEDMIDDDLHSLNPQVTKENTDQNRPTMKTDNKRSIESDMSDKNYNTVTSLSELCFQNLKRIINM